MQSSIAVRVGVCFELLLAGYTGREIYNAMAENSRKAAENEEHDEAMAWNVSERRVRAYCQAARKEFEQVRALKREQALGSSLSRRERMFRRAMELDRVNTARSVQDSIDRLMGLNEGVVGGGDPSKPKGIEIAPGVVVIL